MFEKEKFVERNANAVAAGRIAGIDPVEEITRRCIRIVETADADIGGCALCRFFLNALTIVFLSKLMLSLDSLFY